MSNETDTAAAILRIMAEAGGSQPFMTPAMGAAMAAYIVDELAKIAQSSEGTSVKREWGSRSQVGMIYGMTGQRADDYLIPWAAAGKVRVISPPDPLTGKQGHRRYNLEEVAAAMGAR